MEYTITTQAALRACFWEQHPEHPRKGAQKQNKYPADVRMAWCDFIENMNRAGEISDALAHRVTL